MSAAQRGVGQKAVAQNSCESSVHVLNRVGGEFGPKETVNVLNRAFIKTLGDVGIVAGTGIEVPRSEAVRVSHGIDGSTIGVVRHVDEAFTQSFSTPEEALSVVLLQADANANLVVPNSQVVSDIVAEIKSRNPDAVAFTPFMVAQCVSFQAIVTEEDVVVSEAWRNPHGLNPVSVEPTGSCYADQDEPLSEVMLTENIFAFVRYSGVTHLFPKCMNFSSGDVAKLESLRVLLREHVNDKVIDGVYCDKGQLHTKPYVVSHPTTSKTVAAPSHTMPYRAPRGDAVCGSLVFHRGGNTRVLPGWCHDPRHALLSPSMFRNMVGDEHGARSAVSMVLLSLMRLAREWKYTWDSYVDLCVDAQVNDQFQNLMWTTSVSVESLNDHTVVSCREEYYSRLNQFTAAVGTRRALSGSELKRLRSMTVITIPSTAFGTGFGNKSLVHASRYSLFGKLADVLSRGDRLDMLWPLAIRCVREKYKKSEVPNSARRKRVPAYDDDEFVPLAGVQPSEAVPDLVDDNGEVLPTPSDTVGCFALLYKLVARVSTGVEGGVNATKRVWEFITSKVQWITDLIGSIGWPSALWSWVVAKYDNFKTLLRTMYLYAKVRPTVTDTDAEHGTLTVRYSHSGVVTWYRFRLTEDGDFVWVPSLSGGAASTVHVVNLLEAFASSEGERVQEQPDWLAGCVWGEAAPYAIPATLRTVMRPPDVEAQSRMPVILLVAAHLRAAKDLLDFGRKLISAMSTMGNTIGAWLGVSTCDPVPADEKLREWTTRALMMCGTASSSLPPEVDKAFALVREGWRLIDAAERAGEGRSQLVLAAARAHNKLIDKLAAQTRSRHAPPPRNVEAIGVFIQGAGGTGKDVAAKLLGSSLSLNRSQLGMYTRNPEDAYWSGYDGQGVVIIGDYLQSNNVEDVTKQVLDMFHMISSEAYPINMAALEDKGRLLDARVVITTSNQSSETPWHTIAKIKDPLAYKRRHTYVFSTNEVGPSVGVHGALCPVNDFGEQQFRVVHVDSKAIVPLNADGTDKQYVTLREMVTLLNTVVDRNQTIANELFKSPVDPAAVHMLDRSGKLVVASSVSAADLAPEVPIACSTIAELAAEMSRGPRGSSVLFAEPMEAQSGVSGLVACGADVNNTSGAIVSVVKSALASPFQAMLTFMVAALGLWLLERASMGAVQLYALRTIAVWTQSASAYYRAALSALKRLIRSAGSVIMTGISGLGPFGTMIANFTSSFAGFLSASARDLFGSGEAGGRNSRMSLFASRFARISSVFIASYVLYRVVRGSSKDPVSTLPEPAHPEQTHLDWSFPGSATMHKAPIGSGGDHKSKRKPHKRKVAIQPSPVKPTTVARPIKESLSLMSTETVPPLPLTGAPVAPVPLVPATAVAKRIESIKGNQVQVVVVPTPDNPEDRAIGSVCNALALDSNTFVTVAHLFSPFNATPGPDGLAQSGMVRITRIDHPSTEKWYPLSSFTIVRSEGCTNDMVVFRVNAPMPFRGKDIRELIVDEQAAFHVPEEGVMFTHRVRSGHRMHDICIADKFVEYGYGRSFNITRPVLGHFTPTSLPGDCGSPFVNPVNGLIFGQLTMGGNSPVTNTCVGGGFMLAREVVDKFYAVLDGGEPFTVAPVLFGDEGMVPYGGTEFTDLSKPWTVEQRFAVISGELLCANPSQQGHPYDPKLPVFDSPFRGHTFSTRTSLLRSPAYEDIHAAYPDVKVPALPGFDPAKREDVINAVRVNDPLSFEEVDFCNEVLDHYYPIPEKKYDSWTLEECCAKLDVTTSPGQPWTTDGYFTKGSLLAARTPTAELVAGVEYVTQLLAGNPVAFVRSKLFPVVDLKAKDELRPPGKSPRTVGAVPIHLLLVMMMLFGASREHLIASRHECPVMLGTNPYCNEWSHASDRVFVEGWDTADGDATKMECSVAPQMIEISVKRMGGMYDDGHNAARDNLAWFIGRMFFVFLGLIIGGRGNPSGQYLTTEVNSLSIFLYIVVAFRRVYYAATGQLLSVQGVANLLYVIAYGDDNVLRIRKDCHISFHDVFDEMTNMGLVTGPADKARRGDRTYSPKPEEITFLKRYFKRVFEGGRVYVVAPLEKKSIYSTLAYVKPADPHGLAILSRVQACLVEASLWEEEFYCFVKACAVKVLTTYRIQYVVRGYVCDIPSYADMRAHMLERSTQPPWMFEMDDEDAFLVGSPKNDPYGDVEFHAYAGPGMPANSEYVSWWTLIRILLFGIRDVVYFLPSLGMGKWFEWVLLCIGSSSFGQIIAPLADFAVIFIDSKRRPSGSWLKWLPRRIWIPFVTSYLSFRLTLTLVAPFGFVTSLLFHAAFAGTYAALEAIDDVEDYKGHAWYLRLLTPLFEAIDGTRPGADVGTFRRFFIQRLGAQVLSGGFFFLLLIL